ncbi:MAG: fatty acid desaturase, partial [Geminicoccaceae bacterium]
MSTDEAAIRAALRPFLDRSSARAAALFAVTVAIYLAATAGAVGFEAWPQKLACAVLAGTAIASLFVIGHDAAHGAFVEGRAPNAWLGRIAFLPSLHNYSLWQVAHNRLHHVDVNVKGMNSWSPLSKPEFDALPAWRRALERFYRTPIGLGPYYLRERWWRDKFFPRRDHAVGVRPVFRADFALVALWLAGWVAALAGVGAAWAPGGAVAAVFWGFALPFSIWNYLMGCTVFVQHTSTRVPWFRTRHEWERVCRQETLTVHIEMPRWYGLISHHIMEHPAHHVLPKIPLYHIAAAQRRLNEILGDGAVRERFTPLYLFDTMRRCKLYDYRRHRWLDFDGAPTSKPLVEMPE